MAFHKIGELGKEVKFVMIFHNIEGCCIKLIISVIFIKVFVMQL